MFMYLTRQAVHEALPAPAPRDRHPCRGHRVPTAVPVPVVRKGQTLAPCTQPCEEGGEEGEGEGLCCVREKESII